MNNWIIPSNSSKFDLAKFLSKHNNDVDWKQSANFEVGDVILLSFDIESREYNGRWYTDIRGWKAEKVDANAAGASVTGTPVTALASAAAPAPAPAVAASMAPIPAATDVLGVGGDGDEDLPF